MIWFSCVFAILPASLVYYTLTEIRLSSELLRNGLECHGLIISQRAINPARGARCTNPKVWFTTVKGVIIEGESVGTERFFSPNGGFFASRMEFFDNADAYLCYDRNDPRQFLFVQQLDQTRNYWLLALASIMSVGMLLAGLFSQ